MSLLSVVRCRGGRQARGFRTDTSKHPTANTTSRAGFVGRACFSRPLVAEVQPGVGVHPASLTSGPNGPIARRCQRRQSSEGHWRSPTSRTPRRRKRKTEDLAQALPSQRAGHHCRKPTRRRQPHLGLHEVSRRPALLSFARVEHSGLGCHRCSIFAVCMLPLATVLLVDPHSLLPPLGGPTRGPPFKLDGAFATPHSGPRSWRETLGTGHPEHLGLSWSHKPESGLNVHELPRHDV